MYLQHDSVYPSYHQGFQCDISGSAKCPNKLWGAPSLPFSGYRGTFLEVGRPEREVKHLHLVPRLRMNGATLLLPPPCTLIAGIGKTLLPLLGLELSKCCFQDFVPNTFMKFGWAEKVGGVSSVGDWFNGCKYSCVD